MNIAPPVPRTRRQWEDHWDTYVQIRDERDQLLAEVEEFRAERHSRELAEREAEEAACRELALREEEVVEATVVVGPEPWAVAIFPADHTTSWRDRKATALQDMEEGEVRILVTKATSGQDAIRKVYEAKLEDATSRKRRDGRGEFTDADGHYFAAPLFRPETEQAVLTGQWATNMEVLA